MRSAGSVRRCRLCQSVSPAQGPCLAFLLHQTRLLFRSSGGRHRPGCQALLALCSGCSSHPTRRHSRAYGSTWGSTAGRGVTWEACLMILTLSLRQQHGRRGQQRSLLVVRQVSAAASNSAKQSVGSLILDAGGPGQTVAAVACQPSACIVSQVSSQLEVCPSPLPPHTEPNDTGCRSLWSSHRCPQLAVVMPMCSSRYTGPPTPHSPPPHSLRPTLTHWHFSSCRTAQGRCMAACTLELALCSQRSALEQCCC